MTNQFMSTCLLLAVSTFLACDSQAVDAQGEDIETPDVDDNDETSDNSEAAEDDFGYAFTEPSFVVLGQTEGSVTSPQFIGRAGVNNSMLGPSVKRVQKGIYTVDMRLSPPSSRYIAQVTAIGNNSDYCRVLQTSGKLVDITCHNSAGSAVDSLFSFYATNQLHGNGAIVRTTSSGSSPSSIAVTSGSSSPTVVRNSTGRYTVTLTGVEQPLAKSYTTLTNSYGNSAYVLCKSHYWTRVNGHRTIRVRCDDDSGVATDSRFMLAFLGAPDPDPDLRGQYSLAFVDEDGRLGAFNDSFVPRRSMDTSAGVFSYLLNHDGLPSGAQSGRSWSIVNNDDNSSFCKLRSVGASNTGSAEVKCYTRSGNVTSGGFVAFVVQTIDLP